MALLEPPETLLRLLHECLEEGDKQEEEILNYASFLAAGMADANEFDSTVWRETLEPYLTMEGSQHQSSTVPVFIEKFRVKAVEALTDEDDNDSYGDEEVDEADILCDLRFNLAYGGKILLHKTKLRLLRGRRYALVGQNGVGT